MSVNVIDVVNDAALAIGDPDKTRVALDQWLSIYNRANRELCQKANILKYEDYFDLVGLQQRYEYPQAMTVLTKLEVSETPDDEASFRTLGEIFEDEFRERTSGRYPDATLPTQYFATSSWYHLVPAATVTIEKGGWITYYAIPDQIGLNEMTNGVMQLPDFARDYLTSRMIIHGMTARNRLVEAKAALELWEADMVTLQDKLDDRSLDRVSSIAPRKNRYAGMR